MFRFVSATRSSDAGPGERTSRTWSACGEPWLNDRVFVQLLEFPRPRAVQGDSASPTGRGGPWPGSSPSGSPPRWSLPPLSRHLRARWLCIAFGCLHRDPAATGSAPIAIMALSLIGVSLPTFLDRHLADLPLAVELSVLPSFGRGRPVDALAIWSDRVPDAIGAEGADSCRRFHAGGLPDDADHAAGCAPRCLEVPAARITSLRPRARVAQRGRSTSAHALKTRWCLDHGHLPGNRLHIGLANLTETVFQLARLWAVVHQTRFQFVGHPVIGRLPDADLGLVSWASTLIVDFCSTSPIDPLLRT